MKHIKSSVVAMAGLALATATSHANLVINGGFEDLASAVAITGPNTSGAGWGTYSSISGWTSTAAAGIEIGSAGIYGVTGFSGNVLELDSTANATVSVDHTLGSDGLFTLSFLYAGRSGVASSSDSFDVVWNGLVVASFTPGPTSTSATPYSITLTGGHAAGENNLTFIGTGTSDSYGAIIDDVSVTPVPETSTVVAGVLLLLPLGASAIRGFRKTCIA